MATIDYHDPHFLAEITAEKVQAILGLTDDESAMGNPVVKTKSHSCPARVRFSMWRAWMRLDATPMQK